VISNIHPPQNGFLDRADLADLLLVAIVASGTDSTNDISRLSNGMMKMPGFEDQLPATEDNFFKFLPPGRREGDLNSDTRNVTKSKLSAHQSSIHRPLVDLMCDLALDKFDMDGDSRLNSNEWAKFVDFEPAVPAFAAQLARFMARPLQKLRARKVESAMGLNSDSTQRKAVSAGF
jgi:hypothetical protein